MSELIDNREYRQKVLKELIMELHDGKSVEEVKERFAKVIEGVTAAEISDMEQSLIMEGMPVEEVQRLCDVHSAVFKGSIEEIHNEEVSPAKIKGHPLHTFTIENEAIVKLTDEIEEDLERFMDLAKQELKEKLVEGIDKLWEIDKHYSRKENLLFPYLEKCGITAPPKVMWGVDDEIRELVKNTKDMLLDDKEQKEKIANQLKDLIYKVREMVFKEDSILFPMAIEYLTEDDWISIKRESDEIGYCLVQPEGDWEPERVQVDIGSDHDYTDGERIKLGTGNFSIAELEALLNTLPFDITFIDSDDVVRYFSQGKERLFVRTKAVLGRTVQNCHPPSSVNIVEEILDDFKSGKKDEESFWIEMDDIYAYIRYFAVRDSEGKYLGTIEVTQNIRPIQKIEGEKRLLSD